MVRLLVAVCVLALAVEAGSAPRVVAQGKQVPGVPDGAWVQLGPGDNFNVNQVAVSSQWPADPFILATGYDDQSSRVLERGIERVFPDLIRSSDAGVTWDRFTLPSGGVSSLTIGPASQAGRVVLGLGGEYDENSISSWRTVRSADGADDQGRLALTVFFNAVRQLLRDRPIPPTYELSSPANPIPEGKRIALHEDEGNTVQTPRDYGAISDLREARRDTREPRWPLLLALAAGLFALERLLATFGGRAWR